MSWASRLVWPDDRGKLRRPEWGGLTRRDRWGGQAGSLNCGCRFDFRFVGHKTSTSSTKILERAIRRGFRKAPVLVQAGSHTMEGMKRKEQDEGLLERLNGQPDCGRGREAVLWVHWIFLLGIHVNGSNDCSRTELLSSGVTHFKFMLCRDLDFFSSSPAVWMSIPTQWTLTRLTIVPRHLPFGVLDCHSLLVIRLQAFFFFSARD